MPPCLNTLAYLDATIANFLSHFSTPNSISNIPVRKKRRQKTRGRKVLIFCHLWNYEVSMVASYE